MEQAYQYLLSLEFRHKYFKDGLFKPLQLSFDAESQQLLKNFGLILKSYPGGLHLLCLDPELLNEVSISTPLRIFLECNDPYYINYSELNDFSPSSNVLYLSNLGHQSNSNEMQLHSDNSIGQNEMALMTFGKFILPKTNQNNEYILQDVFGNNISNRISRLPNNNQGDSVFQVDNLPEGLIKVIFENKEQLLYYTPKTVWKKPLGILNLYLSNLYAHFKKNNDNRDARLKYTLNFSNRSTIWKYFLVSPIYKNFLDLSIIDSNKDQIFNPPKKEQLEGMEVLVLESKKRIELKEFSSDNFQLVEKFDIVQKTGKPTVISSLPRAAPEQLYGNKLIFGETLYSHIYL